MTNDLILKIIADSYDLQVQWDNLVADRDDWSELAQRLQAEIVEKNKTIDKLSNGLYECQKDLEKCQNPEAPDF